MIQKWYQSYARILSLFEQGKSLQSYSMLDEVNFYFRTDPEEVEHYIGYDPENADTPYWAGLCDIPGGAMYSSAGDLFEAKIYNGMSIRQRWQELVLCGIGGINPEELDELV